MLNTIVTTNVIFYLMAAVGVVGVLAKLISHMSLKRLVKASANMSKSTHRLIKLVRSKYEHACMIHDSVENTEVFIDRFIQEYRALFLRLHTWRQLERQVIWFSGILGLLGSAAHYYQHGFCEEAFQFGALGAAEMILLFVIYQLTDERYKVEMMKVYMIDYLENVCAHRYRKTKKNEKEKLSVISPESSAPLEAAPEVPNIKKEEEDKPLAIEIETERPKEPVQNEQPALKEAVIRQILEEFLA